MASGISDEEIKFAKITATEFATWGFEHISKVTDGKMSSDKYYHEMILWAIRRFAGDFAMAGRFLLYALPPNEYVEMRSYSQKVSRNLQQEKLCSTK
jgi:hypothetical protein